MIYNKSKIRNGFTTIELVLVFALIAILTTITTGNLLRIRHRASLSSTISGFINDLKEQQHSAMLEGVEHGIYIDSSGYRLDQFVVEFDPNIQITQSTFPDDQIVFASLSGEIKNYTPGQNTLVIQNSTDNEAKIININRFGVITSIL